MISYSKILPTSLQRIYFQSYYIWKPKKFKKYLTEGILTTEMLAMYIYSLNKRAKNYRDRRANKYKSNRYSN